MSFYLVNKVSAHSLNIMMKFSLILKQTHWFSSKIEKHKGWRTSICLTWLWSKWMIMWDLVLALPHASKQSGIIGFFPLFLWEHLAGGVSSKEIFQMNQRWNIYQLTIPKVRCLSVIYFQQTNLHILYVWILELVC
jgi:hypothetical protein